MYTRLNLEDRVPGNPGRLLLTPVDGQPNTYDMTLADNPAQAGDKVNAAVFTHMENEFVTLDTLRADTVPGLTAIPTIAADGSIAKIDHKASDGTIVRSDVFTYATNLITEVRTLSTGETVTLKYHTDTLEIEVI